MMTCKSSLHTPAWQEGWPCNEGQLLVPLAPPYARTLLDLDIVPESQTFSCNRWDRPVLRVRAYLWDESGQAYLSETVMTGEDIWEYFFEDEVTYTREPEEFIRGEIQWRYAALSGPVAVTEFKIEAMLHRLEGFLDIPEHCGNNRALWVNCKNEVQTRSKVGKNIAAGSIVGVPVRQKKLDLQMRLWVKTTACGLVPPFVRQLPLPRRDCLECFYAVASEIRGVWWDYPAADDSLDGPLVSKIHPSTLFGPRWPGRFQRVERDCPGPEYMSVRIQNPT